MSHDGPCGRGGVEVGEGPPPYQLENNHLRGGGGGGGGARVMDMMDTCRTCILFHTLLPSTLADVAETSRERTDGAEGAERAEGAKGAKALRVRRAQRVLRAFRERRTLTAPSCEPQAMRDLESAQKLKLFRPALKFRI